MAVGVPAREIQDLADHQDLKTTPATFTLLPGARHDAIQRLYAERQAQWWRDRENATTPFGKCLTMNRYW